MEILQLIYFCSAAETENFTKTAEKFGVPATGISQSVRRLERELGVALFDRTSNEIRLNERGKMFYQNVQSSLEILDDAKKKVQDDELIGTIKLLIKTNRFILNQAIEVFHNQHKNVSFDLDYEWDGKPSKYDLIITDNFAFHDTYKRNRLLTEPIKLLLSKNHPLAAKPDLTPDDLKQEKFLAFHEGTGMAHLTEHICAMADFAPEIYLRSDDPITIIQCLRGGAGVALVPELEFSPYLDEQLCMRYIAPVTRSTVVCFSKHKTMTKPVRLFLETLYTVAARQI